MRRPFGAHLLRGPAPRAILYSMIALACVAADASRVVGAEPSNPAAPPSDTAAAQRSVDAKRQEIYDLQQKLIPLLRSQQYSSGDAALRERVAALENEIATRSKQLALLSDGGDEASGQARIAEQLAALQASMADRQGQVERLLGEYQETMKRFEEAQSVSNLPPLKNPVTKVYALKYVEAPRAAAVINDLFGGVARIAQDGQRLIIAADDPPSAQIEVLLSTLDAPASDPPRPTTGSSTDNEEQQGPATLLVRVFWIGDGVPDKDSAAADLPTGVISALGQLGLRNPVLIAQAVNSLNDDASESVSFSTRIPTVAYGQPVELQGEGAAKWLSKERLGINLKLRVEGAMSCELAGSLAMPLGHYMVLGTANSTIADAASGIDPTAVLLCPLKA